MKAQADHYPSRVGGQEKMLPRLDPVVYDAPDIPLEHRLSPAQAASYAENGFLVLPDVFTDLVDELRAEIPRLAERMAGREELYTEPDSGDVRTLFKPFAYSALIDRISRDRRILDPVRQLLGSEVYIMQSRVNVKPPFTGRSFAWHSDFETWHVEDGMPRMRALTAWIMLNDNHEHNGPLYVIPGSHRHYVSCAGVTGANNHLTSLRRQTLGVPQPDTIRPLVEAGGIRSIKGSAGTLVIHECNLLHGSPDNISADPRTILMFVFNSVENRNERPFSGLPPRPHYLNNPDTRPLVAR